MIEEREISNIAKETLAILKFFSKSFISKIPKHTIDELEQLSKNSNIIINIDKNKSLREQHILSGTKDMIALIYYSYIASESEKEEIEKIWNKNENSYQEKMKQHNLDNIFRKKTTTNEQQNNAMIEYKKETVFQKIINKIKKLLRVV